MPGRFAFVVTIFKMIKFQLIIKAAKRKSTRLELIQFYK